MRPGGGTHQKLSDKRTFIFVINQTNTIFTILKKMFLLILQNESQFQVGTRKVSSTTVKPVQRSPEPFSEGEYEGGDDATAHKMPPFSLETKTEVFPNKADPSRHQLVTSFFSFFLYFLAFHLTTKEKT